jgi:hypothetical protein
MTEEKQRGSVLMKTVPLFILIMAVALPLQGQVDFLQGMGVALSPDNFTVGIHLIF